MQALGRTQTLAFVLGALAMGCAEERASNDGVLDGGLDAGLIDASTGAGDSAVACTSWSAPTAATCGGSHCRQAPAQLRTETPTTATCGTNEEVAALCSLEAVDAVGDCAKQEFALAAPTKACAMAKLGAKVGSNCLDCFVTSAQCAAANCLTECGVDRRTAACDACRVRNNCVSQFYTCAGIKNPDPAAP